MKPQENSQKPIEEEIAEVFGISEAGVNQTLKSALFDCKNLLREVIRPNLTIRQEAEVTLKLAEAIMKLVDLVGPVPAGKLFVTINKIVTDNHRDEIAFITEPTLEDLAALGFEMDRIKAERN